jgi:hypothetical protein
MRLFSYLARRGGYCELLKGLAVLARLPINSKSCALNARVVNSVNNLERIVLYKECDLSDKRIFSKD